MTKAVTNLCLLSLCPPQLDVSIDVDMSANGRRSGLTDQRLGGDFIFATN